MRVSVNRGDPDYVDDAHLYTVFLNGERLNHCVCADDVAGEVLVSTRCGPDKLLRGEVRIVYG